MRFIHIADLHASRSRAEPCMKALNQILSYIKSATDKPKLLIAGDFWDASITAGPTFGAFVSKVKEILEETDVFMVYGTATHEIGDSLKAFDLIGCNVFESNNYADYGDWELIALPEPRRSNYISGLKQGEDINNVINRNFEQFVDSLPPKTKPRIVLGHGEILGCNYESGIPCSSKVAFNPSTLKKINADYYAFGHIHKPQEVFENCWYSGSCYPKNFGESHDASFRIVEIL